MRTQREWTRRCPPPSYRVALPRMPIPMSATVCVVAMVLASIVDSTSGHIVVEVGSFIGFWTGYTGLWILLGMDAMNLWKSWRLPDARRKSTRIIMILCGLLLVVHVGLVAFVMKAI